MKGSGFDQFYVRKLCSKMSACGKGETGLFLGGEQLVLFVACSLRGENHQKTRVSMNCAGFHRGSNGECCIQSGCLMIRMIIDDGKQEPDRYELRRISSQIMSNGGVHPVWLCHDHWRGTLSGLMSCIRIYLRTFMHIYIHMRLCTFSTWKQQVCKISWLLIQVVKLLLTPP